MIWRNCLALGVAAFAASPLFAAASAVSANTIVLSAPCREQVSVESARLDHFSSEKVGLSFVIR